MELLIVLKLYTHRSGRIFFRASLFVLFSLLIVGCESRQFDGVINPNGHTSVNEIINSDHFWSQSLRIFPGAEGFGTSSRAGRGGKVCIVENLNATGEGSFRSCVEESGPRVVLFEVGGTIEVETPIVIRNPYISIYGQSATGDGILLRANELSGESPLNVETHDVLIQHLRVRAGSAYHETCCRDALRVGSQEKNAVYNVVIDHNSFSWGTDQIASSWFDSNNITFSYNFFSESLHDNDSNKGGPGGRGLLVGSEGSHSISIHHNIFAHSFQRNPLLVTSGVVDVVNNLIFHWVSRAGQQESRFDGQRVNWVGNRFIGLKNSQTKFGQATSYGWGDILLTETNVPMKGSVYFEDNIGRNKRWPWQEEWEIANTDYATSYDPALSYHSQEKFEAPQVTIVAAKKLIDVLPGIVGATLPVRDTVDKRIVEELFSKSGFMPNCIAANENKSENRCSLNVGGWPTMMSGESREDYDRDGLPDEWEAEYGTAPDLMDSQNDLDGDGYSNLEAWLFGIPKQ